MRYHLAHQPPNFLKIKIEKGEIYQKLKVFVGCGAIYISIRRPTLGQSVKMFLNDLNISL
jgi:hypothetical protein